jgi:DNA-binding NtrC family response regulator
MEPVSEAVSLLVVDDDPGFRRLLETILRGEGYDVDTAGNVAGARNACGRKRYRLVISDLRLPDGDGLDVQKWFLEHAPQTACALITGFGTVATAVEAMRRGAVDYLEKPLRSPDELRRLVRRALAVERTQSALSAPPALDAGFACANLIARDPHMLRVLELAKKVAPTAATVLLMGESGTGKEVLARCIHGNSQRASGVFLAVNCASLAPSLIESELFGHEKGSFTGAVERHAGVFERAQGGTLFLDEIAELDAGLQAKLLRVLQERMLERVGGGKPVEVDVRVVAATNRDLPAMVREGRFRTDLYYRLNTFPLEIPALRERPEDLDALADWFLDEAARRMQKPALRLSEAARAVLRSHAWPGNVRELENVMERAAILAEGVVEPEHLSVSSAPDAPPAASRGPLNMKEIERRAIEEALQKHGGNRTHAARELGISLRTLQYRLKEYGLS